MPPAELNSLRPTTMPARNAPRAIDTPNTMAEPTAMPSATTSTVSVNSSRERVERHVMQQPGNNPPTDYEDRGTSTATLTVATSDRRQDRATGRVITKHRRQDDEHDHRKQVLHDQPSHGNVSGGRVQVAVVGQHAEQHDRAGHGDCQPKENSPRPVPAESPHHDGAQQRGNRDLHQRPGNCYAAHGQQFFNVKLQSHAEHQ